MQLNSNGSLSPEIEPSTYRLISQKVIERSVTALIKRKEQVTMNKQSILFEQLNSFFDKIYVISLQRSSDRHPRLKRNLKGLDYEISWGVDGTTLDLKELEEKEIYLPEVTVKKNFSGKELQPGEIGCSLSHLNIYKEILKNGYRRTLILEDDIFVSNERVENIRNAFRELPEEWEFLYLGYLENQDEMPFSVKLRIHFAYPLFQLAGLKRYDPEQLKRKYYRPYSDNLELAGFHTGTHAYGVSLNGAKKILKEQNPVIMAPDNIVGKMCLEGNLHAFRLKEQVFYQYRDFPTTIENRYKPEFNSKTE